MNRYERIHLNISIDDTEEVSYLYSNKNLMFKIVNWERKVLHFVFFGIIKFVDWQKPDEISLLVKVVDHNPGVILNKYIFLDRFEKPCYEITCNNYSFDLFKNNDEYNRDNRDLKDLYEKSS